MPQQSGYYNMEDLEPLVDLGSAPLAPSIHRSLFDVLGAPPKEEEKEDKDTPSPGSADGISIGDVEFPDDNLASWMPPDAARTDAQLPDALDDDFSPPHLPPSDDPVVTGAHFFSGEEWAKLPPEQVATFQSGVSYYNQSELEAAWKADNVGRGHFYSPEQFEELPCVQGWLQDDAFGPNLRAGGRKVLVARRGSDSPTEEQMQEILASIVFDDVSVPMPASEPARAPVRAPVRASKRKVGAPPLFALLGEWEFSTITKPEPKRKKARKQVEVEPASKQVEVKPASKQAEVKPASKQAEVKYSLRRREVNVIRGASPFRLV